METGTNSTVINGRRRKRERKRGIGEEYSQSRDIPAEYSPYLTSPASLVLPGLVAFPAWSVGITTDFLWAVPPAPCSLTSAFPGQGLILRVPIFLVGVLQCPEEEAVGGLVVEDLEVEDLEGFSDQFFH